MGNLGSWSYVDGRERGAKISVVYGDRARRRWSISSVTSWNSEEGTISAIGADNVQNVNRAILTRIQAFRFRHLRGGYVYDKPFSYEESESHLKIRSFI